MVLRRNASRSILIEELSKGICKVTFRKATNGRFRSIIGTLKPSLIPGQYQKTIIEINKAQDDPDLLPFYDIKEGKWKSFYIYNIISFLTEEEIRRK